MATVIQVKRGTASAWTSANTVLTAGEIGFESDTKKMKVGDGSTAWTSLAYTATDGDITAVVAGTGLSGGSTSGSATLAIDTSVVVDKTTAQTLTNKTLTSPVLTTPTISTATTNGDILYGTGSGALARLGIGSTDQVLKVTAGVPAWSTPAASTPTFVGCSIYNSASGNHPNNTEAMLTFDSEFFDTNGFHDTSTNTGRITIPTGYGGKYAVHYSVRPVANSTGYRYLAIYKNNVSFVQLMEVVANGLVSATGARSVIINLSAGDYLTFYYYQNSGGAMTTYYREYEHPVQVQWLGA
jgi:hypothetical protein